MLENLEVIEENKSLKEEIAKLKGILSELLINEKKYQSGSEQSSLQYDKKKNFIVKEE